MQTCFSGGCSAYRSIKDIGRNIVDYRDNNGAFANRKQLLEVPRMGPKAFEQAAGFLASTRVSSRWMSSAVHPEAYTVVERIAAANNVPVQELMET